MRTDVVLNKRLRKDIGKLSLFCHTGGLEVYLCVITMYCPKREHFQYNRLMVAQTPVALKHNHNVKW